MKEMGLMHYFLGLEVSQGDGELFVFQGKYATDILPGFHMENCKVVDKPLAPNSRKEYASSGGKLYTTIYKKLVG